MTKQKIQQILKTTLQGIIVLLISLVLALLLRIFLFASFKIPSQSMLPAIEAGENILVNKLIPGPRVYKNFDFRDGKKVETQRFKGIRSIPAIGDYCRKIILFGKRGLFGNLRILIQKNIGGSVSLSL